MYRLKGSPTEGLFGATLGFFIGFAEMTLSSPLGRRRSYHRAYHTPEKSYE